MGQGLRQFLRNEKALRNHLFCRKGTLEAKSNFHANSAKPDAMLDGLPLDVVRDEWILRHLLRYA